MLARKEVWILPCIIAKIKINLSPCDRVCARQRGRFATGDEESTCDLTDSGGFGGVSLLKFRLREFASEGVDFRLHFLDGILQRSVFSVNKRISLSFGFDWSFLRAFTAVSGLPTPHVLDWGSWCIDFLCTTFVDSLIFAISTADGDLFRDFVNSLRDSHSVS